MNQAEYYERPAKVGTIGGGGETPEAAEEEKRGLPPQRRGGVMRRIIADWTGVRLLKTPKQTDD